MYRISLYIRREKALEKGFYMNKILGLFNPFIFFRIVSANRFLLWQMVRRNVEARYKGSFLGLFWSFVQPLMMLCVYTFVFSVVFKMRWGMDTEGSRGAFAIIMLCGMSLYSIFSEALSTAGSLIVSNQNYVKKVIFPLEILPIAQTASSFIVGLVWFILLFLGVVFIFGRISWTMLLLPLILLPLFLFTCGISFFVASLGGYIRDTQYIIGVILQVLFFITPIFYPIQAVPEKFRWPLQINPLTILIEETRKIFLYGQLPSWPFLGISFLTAILVFHCGFMWFYKTKKGFADVL